MPIPGLEHLVPFILQRGGDQRTHGGLVVHDQDGG
jgi:hypothetical protein